MPVIVINDKRVLFVHIPKTGGTSITRWMQSMGRVRLHGDVKPEGLKISAQHLTWTDIDCMWGGDYFDYCFAVVRNPFSRMESEFGMRQKLRAQGFFGGQLHFSSWLERTLIDVHNNPNHFDNHIRPQWNFIADRIRIFRFEDGMTSILTQVATDLRVALPDSTPHLLSSSGAGKKAINWDRADILRMQDYYRMDFQQFGYSLEPEAPTISEI